MRKHFSVLMLALSAVLLLLTGCKKEEVPRFTAAASVSVEPETIGNIRLTLPEGMYREHISDIQDDFLLNDQQVGGIVLVDIPEELLDSPMKGLFEITELLRQQLMPDVPAEEVDIISWGGSQNAYMELAVGPEEIDYFYGFLIMWISAKTRSSVFAVLIPPLMLLLPMFLHEIYSYFMRKVIGLLPHWLMDIGQALRYQYLYKVGGQITCLVPIILILYFCLTMVLICLCYWEYRHKQIA